MSDDSSKCFDSNLELAKSSMGERVNLLNWDVIKTRRDNCRLKENTHPWQFSKENIFGKEIFNKIILKTVSGVTQRELNEIERKYINSYMINGEEKGWHSLNYTGKVKKL